MLFVLQILYITRDDFFDTVKRYPHEASYFEDSLREIKAEYSALVEKYAIRHRDVSLIFNVEVIGSPSIQKYVLFILSISTWHVAV